ncbi:MAG: phosphotransferase, partial [Myxococcota bacterium]
MNPVEAQLEQALNASFGQQDRKHISVEPVAELSNINHVFRCTSPERTYYLKLARADTKRLGLHLPAERIFSEARGLQLAKAHFAGRTVVPEVVKVDQKTFSILMSDVGSGRSNLSRDIGHLHREDGLPTPLADLAAAIGRFHRGTAGQTTTVSVDVDTQVREFAYRHLLSPGITNLMGHSAHLLLREMAETKQCLIHSDLWAKNVLLAQSGPPALLDFEGTMAGDPAFDLSTLIAVVTLPVFQFGLAAAPWRKAMDSMLFAYEAAVADPAWYREISARAFRYLSVMLAARSCGPFPYPMSDEGRSACDSLAEALFRGQVQAVDQLEASLTRYSSMEPQLPVHS